MARELAPIGLSVSAPVAWMSPDESRLRPEDRTGSARFHKRALKAGFCNK